MNPYQKFNNEIISANPRSPKNEPYYPGKYSQPEGSFPSTVLPQQVQYIQSYNPQPLPTQIIYQQKPAPIIVHTEPSQMITHGAHPAHTHQHGSHGGEGEEELEYEPLKIPANWELAEKHAKATKVSIAKTNEQLQQLGKKQEVCPCCNYQIEREDIPYLADISKINFLGSGYVCFYNFIIYCTFILAVLFAVSGIYNIATNYLGSNCLTPDQDLALAGGYKKESKEEKEKEEEDEEEEGLKVCHYNWAHVFSLANKMDMPKFLWPQSNLNLIVGILVMIILMFFRRSQRELDNEVDAQNVTPSDYTIVVKNIPKGLNINYKDALTTLFGERIPLLIKQKHDSEPVQGNEDDSHQPEQQQYREKYEITNINFIYNIDEVIELEEEIQSQIKQKQKHLEEVGGFFQPDEELHKIDEEIEKIEKKIHEKEKQIQHEPDKFTGIAFISFQYEDDKQNILEFYPQTFSVTMQRIHALFHNGQVSNLNQDDITLEGQKLFIEPAPEPNDVDWEFYHCSTFDKIKGRIKSYLLNGLFMFGCFLMIFGISKWQGKLIDEAYEAAEQGQDSEKQFNKVRYLSIAISTIIVLFNKFVIGVVIHHIVDLEKISTKSKFNISYAQKYAFALFLNSALITYFVEILGEKNYYGPGGFIYTETLVFVWNCFIPPIVWMVDPWSILKIYQRKKELTKKSQGKSFVTQKEANFLMEHPDYLQGKRYADIMKTMWFTFFYAPCIPLGIFFSILNLILYYYIDKFNLLKRRTIKESLDKSVSVEMIEMLEMSIIYYAIGNATFSLQLFHKLKWQEIVLLIIGVIYAALPMQEFNEYLFKMNDYSESKSYNEAKHLFFTNYDKENPITKHEALHEAMKHQIKNVEKENMVLKQFKDTPPKIMQATIPQALLIQQDSRFSHNNKF